MSNEDLMQVRFKVIASFPGMNFIGDSGFSVGNVFHPEFKHGLYFHNGVGVEGYPHLFKKLEWWEDRKLEDMPPYIKEEGGLIKKAEYYFDNGFMRMKLDDGDNWYITKRTMPFFTPAAEEDLNNQNNTSVSY